MRGVARSDLPQGLLDILHMRLLKLMLKQALVERYDAVKFGIFQRNVSNFRGLVLFCIEADFCNQILILLAFFDIYKICTPSHRSEVEILAKIRQTFSYFC